MMARGQALTGSTAATRILRWLQASHAAPVVRVDLDQVLQGLPGTPLAKDVREICPPVAADLGLAFEGMLARDPMDPGVWGIAYSANSSPERQRFTIAHELGHLILHRSLRQKFNCDKAGVHLALDSSPDIEREANEFASNLLMPGDVLREAVNRRRVDLHLLSDLARQFDVSFEALCLRFIRYTDQRAILIRWDNGYLDYECRSDKAVRTRARVRRISDPQEPLAGTVAADATIAQEWDGVEMSAAIWCPEEAPYMKLREFKHTHATRHRVLTLLILESAEPRAWDRSWRDEEEADGDDQFIPTDQHPVR